MMPLGRVLSVLKTARRTTNCLFETANPRQAALGVGH